MLYPFRLCFTFRNQQVIIHKGCFPEHYTLSGAIFEDSSFVSIPYVSVSIAGRSEGCIADHLGRFELNISWSDDKYDTLVFSSMGYVRDTLIIEPEKAEFLNFFMKEKFFKVEPVIILPTKYDVFEVGNTANRTSGNLYLDTHGQQTALFISAEKNRKGYITSVSYYLSERGNTDAPFRVRIYEADSTGMPGKDLIEDALVVKPEQGGGWYTISLLKLGINMPEQGIFVAIEGVFPDDFDHYYGDTEFIDLRKMDRNSNQSVLNYGQRLGYNRKCRKDTWHYSISKVWFQLESQSFGVMISAVVKYEMENEEQNTYSHE
ncbi:MAG: carboxypeptidase-like regulatory domain-containing protein [Bacteroidales bacterium]|nr:carboxypeptidase-like regulatory domain-containing protein [Bacteroidales bacterium]